MYAEERKRNVFVHKGKNVLASCRPSLMGCLCCRSVTDAEGNSHYSVKTNCGGKSAAVFLFMLCILVFRYGTSNG